MGVGTKRPNTWSWSHRAKLGELQAVCNASGSHRKNLMLHGMHVAAAKKALYLAQERGAANQPVVLDFGCGNGRLVRFFGGKNCKVVGLDIAREMLAEGRKYGVPRGSMLAQFNGVSIPLDDASVDIVWICGVLKYTAFPPGAKCRHGNSQEDGNGTYVPTLPQVAREVYRVLRPGGIVVNLEIYFDEPPDIFIREFESAGFVTDRVSLVRRYRGLPERASEWRDCHRLSPRLISLVARVLFEFRYRLDNARSQVDGTFRDYFFLWRK